ncbi:hypothetical protein L914_06026 [Phytophthora nicotianae]|uniref:Uncharacterized protein n=1 Tax=Phytophthora nicotianae TaxID=4792 RepID=W2NQ50_PHYNI|nr:hypothetical protein L914_06026 [Phytophthora nicotianae]
MNQSVKPPKILFVRPKSAGSVRTCSQSRTSLTPTSQTSAGKPAPQTPSISLTGTIPPQPVRPVSNTARRPSSAVGSRRCFAPISIPTLPKTAREGENVKKYLWQGDPLGPEVPSSVDGSIYHVIVARKDAEDTAQQLARRISHFRAQEERVVREMQTMRTRLETNLKKTREGSNFRVGVPGQVRQMPRSMHLPGQNATSLHQHVSQGNSKQKGGSTSPGYKRKLNVPRSREQREFLAKQKRALEQRKLEVARQQRERVKLALAGQKAKEADQEYKRRCRNERIRAEEQQVIELRVEKQRQLREAATKQHYERLMAEKQRQHEALNLVTLMEEEERNLRLRLEALHFHREYMEQELCGGVPPLGHQAPDR